jgi:adenine deaminase
LLQTGDPADFIIVTDLCDFGVRQAYVDGHLIAENGTSRIAGVGTSALNRWGATCKRVGDFHVPARDGLVRVIDAFDGQLVTNELHLPVPADRGGFVADIAADVLKH